MYNIINKVYFREKIMTDLDLGRRYILIVNYILVTTLASTCLLKPEVERQCTHG